MTLRNLKLVALLFQISYLVECKHSPSRDVKFTSDDIFFNNFDSFAVQWTIYKYSRRYVARDG